jgi:hypothetical protein
MENSVKIHKCNLYMLTITRLWTMHTTKRGTIPAKTLPSWCIHLLSFPTPRIRHQVSFTVHVLHLAHLNKSSWAILSSLASHLGCAFGSTCSTSAAPLLGHRPRQVIGHIWSSRRASGRWSASEHGCVVLRSLRQGEEVTGYSIDDIRCRRILDDLYAWLRLKL